MRLMLNRGPEHAGTDALCGDYIRASDGLVSRPVAGYIYSTNWAICTGGTLTR